MAFDRNAFFPGLWLPADISRPQGNAKSSTTPQSKDGSPWAKDLINDYEGYFQGLLFRAGITPSGSPDTALVSDYLDALGQISGITHKTIASAIADDKLKPGMYILTANNNTTVSGGGAPYEVKTAIQAGIDGDTIDGNVNHASTGNVLLVLILLPINFIVDAKACGVLGDGSTNDFVAAKAAVDYCIIKCVELYFPGSITDYVVSSQIPINGPITITGAGRGEDTASANPGTGQTSFRPAGAGLFLIKSDTSGNWITGVVMRNFAIDGNNVASIGIHGRTIAGCVIDQVLVTRCTVSGITLDDDNGNISVYNNINNYHYSAGANVAADASEGIVFNSTTAGFGGVVQTIMDNITTNTKDGDGISLSGCDNNIIMKHQGFIQAGGVGVSLRFANGTFLTARNNLVFYVTGSVHAENTTFGNRIMHSPSEGAVFTIDTGGQLHYETHDYINGDLHKTHSYRMSDEFAIAATAMEADGTIATKGVHASQWGAILFPDAVTGTAYLSIPASFDWNDGEVLGLDLIFSSDTANTSDNFRITVKMSAMTVADATGTPTVDQGFSVPVNDLPNRVNKERVVFPTPLPFGRGDILTLAIRRFGGDGADTALGEMELLGVNLVYQSAGPNSGGSGPYDVSPPFI